MKNLSKEKQGEIIMAIEIVLWAAFPILIRSSDDFLPPILFAAFSALLASIFSGIWLYKKGLFHELFNKKALPFMISSSFLIAVIYFPAITIFGQKIASGNTALLIQGEMLFTFLIFGISGLEIISAKTIFGAILVLIGALIIILKDFTGEFNIWDLSLFLITISAPLANIFQKKVVQIVNPLTQIVFRNFLGGVCLLIIGFSLEDFDLDKFISLKGIWLIFAAGILVNFLRANLFLEAIKRIDVSKAIAMNGAMPAVALILGYVFLNEEIRLAQIISFILVFSGVFLLTRKEVKEKSEM